MSAVVKLALNFAALISAAQGLATVGHAQDIGFGLGDAYRYYADPGNGGGSAYAPFFDPYRGNRIVRGAYPNAYYDGYGYHYGKSAPPSLYVVPPFDLSNALPLHEGETRTTPQLEYEGGNPPALEAHRRRSCRRDLMRRNARGRCMSYAR